MKIKDALKFVNEKLECGDISDESELILRAYCNSEWGEVDFECNYVKEENGNLVLGGK